MSTQFRELREAKIDLAEGLIGLMENLLQVDDVFDNETITKFVVENYLPEQVFSFEQLQQWALENGFFGGDAA